MTTTASTTPRPLVVGLGGYLHSGKDAVADRLVDVHGFGKHFMSEPMAAGVHSMNPWIRIEVTPGRTFERKAFGGVFNLVIEPRYRFVKYQELIAEIGYTEAKKIPEVREALQIMGWDVGRGLFGDDAWVQIIRRNMEVDIAAGRSVALTGVRTAEEIALIEELGGTLIWLDRPNDPDRDATATTSGHATENSVSEKDFHQTILNDGTLDHLAAKVDIFANAARA